MRITHTRDYKRNNDKKLVNITASRHKMMKRQKTYTTLMMTVLLMLLPTFTASASDVITAPTDTIDYGNYSYVRFLSESESVTISDEEFNDIAGKVIVPVNKYTLPDVLISVACVIAGFIFAYIFSHFKIEERE